MPEHLQAELSLTLAQLSVAGHKPQNEDAIGIRIPKGALLCNKGAVAVIADGVSAAEAGKEASETCVQNFLNDYFSTPDSWTVKKSTLQVLTALNRWLYSQGQHFWDAQKGYVSTFSCIIFKSQTAHIFHVGDSRIYRYRQGHLEQLTRDHTTVINRKQSYLARAMGLDTKLDVDYQSTELEADDIYFLSTDGIHDFMKTSDISKYLKPIAKCKEEKQFTKTCQLIVDKAMAGGSGDNLSCQIIHIDTLPNQTMNEVSRRLTQLPFPPHLEPGMVLDNYQIEKQLHANSRSQVYLVKDNISGKRFCMKTPSANYEDDLSYIERFTMESWIGSRIKNAHVLKIIESNRPRTFLYYITEYISGITLEQWIKQNPNPAIQDVVYIIEQIVKGLRAMHRRETLHQDIRPANIMIAHNGEATIIDFGSCFVNSIAEITSPLEQERQLGTAGYSAPEVVLTNKSSIRSELFSVAVIAFEMLTGTEPFKGKLSKCRSSADYLNTKYIPCFDYNPLLPIWIDGAIKKALRFQPERRFEDVSEFLYELKHPNPKYKQKHNAALLERNPLRFWKINAVIWFTAFCISLLIK